MSSRLPLVIGNWKMNPERESQARQIVRDTVAQLGSTAGLEVAVCPPFLFLPAVKEELKGLRKIALGAQNAFGAVAGSQTGEISITQLADYGVRYVILGHSERRALGETDQQIAQKAAFALQADLDVVLCVGEQERDENGEYLSWLEEEISNSLSGVSGRYLGQLTIAYEPIWAIGGERAMDGTAIHEMVVFIRRSLSRLYGKTYATRPRIIYGGSVNPDNIEEIMTDGEVDGVLPGRASREPEQFRQIVEVVRRSKAVAGH